MSVIIVFIILATIGQVVVCGFSLWFVIGLICRLLFGLRGIGVIFKTRPIFVGECVALATMLLWYLLFHKDAVPWLTVLFNFLFVGFTIFLEWLDGILYVYEVIDEDEL